MSKKRPGWVVPMVLVFAVIGLLAAGGAIGLGGKFVAEHYFNIHWGAGDGP